VATKRERLVFHTDLVIFVCFGLEFIMLALKNRLFWNNDLMYNKRSKSIFLFVFSIMSTRW
jgi:hypothetical protein